MYKRQAYARQFLGKINKPDVDIITGIAPAIAIEQKVNTCLLYTSKPSGIVHLVFRRIRQLLQIQQEGDTFGSILLRFAFGPERIDQPVFRRKRRAGEDLSLIHIYAAYTQGARFVVTLKV